LMNGSIFSVTADKQIMRILIFFILRKILFYSFKKKNGLNALKDYKYGCIRQRQKISLNIFY